MTNSTPLRLLLATSNPHKRDEIMAVWEPLLDAVNRVAVELVTLDQIGLDIPEPVEDQPTFEGNAQLKAGYYATHANLPCLADDSGLEVDALAGEPGVRSARYAGQTGERSIVDPANNRLLLEKLGQTPIEQRTSRFVCAMALVVPDGPDNPPRTIAVVRGTIEGRILGPGDAGFDSTNPASSFRGRGPNGFGYDPLFVVPNLNQTTAELTPSHKNAISHRGQAARKMWAFVKGLGKSMATG